MIKKRKKIFFTLSLFLSMVLPVFAFAQKTLPIDNPLKGLTDPRDLIGNVIAGVLGLVGSLALLMFIFGGITWMIAAGNPEKVKKGKDMLVWAVLGLTVIFTSYALVQFVFITLTQNIDQPDTGTGPAGPNTGKGPVGP